ncbi:rhomboid family intramembrane serine protease [Candidatus Pacearchaeota archaeon]|nr:MAG: rhomboid family intramembrane serine protease [Candidatus Pacearchaeota archaeon]
MKAYRLNPHVRRRFTNLNINMILIFINIFLFVLFSILIYSNAKFLDYIALKPSNILSGKYLWTFLTSMFMHGGFFHIFANMFSLFFIGGLIERILGPKRYLWFYLLSGLFAGLFFVLLSFIFSSDFNTYAVGASGALFGLIGFLMMITPNLPVYIMFIPIPIKMKYAAPGILAVLWLISIAGNVPIGNTAHLGGLILGLIYGVYLRKKYKRKTQYISKFFS